MTDIEALKDLDKTTFSDHDVVHIAGYYDAGDGGGGPFYIDKTDTTTPDDGCFTIVADDGARWKSLPQ